MARCDARPPVRAERARGVPPLTDEPGVTFTNLDEPLFAEANATKRDLVSYLDAMSAELVAELHDRPLTVVRALRGEAPFMQKNVPRYTPRWVRTVTLWAETSHRDVAYALCNDRRTLLWFANQRAIEYHPALVRVDHLHAPLYLVLDLDPPPGDTFTQAVRAAALVRQTLSAAGLDGALKTSGAKGLHVFIPVRDAGFEEVAAAARALAERTAALDPSVGTTAFIKDDRGGRVFIDSTRNGGATVVAAYSPRVRPDVPVSFPVRWEDLDRVSPRDFTIRTVPRLLHGEDTWRARMPAPQVLDAALVDEGRSLPLARVQAMHEGKRRARARRAVTGSD